MTLKLLIKSCHSNHECSCDVGLPSSLSLSLSDPATQQVAPYLYQASKNLGGMATTIPYMQEASRRVMGMMQGVQGAQEADGLRQASSSRNTIVREYRDVRPSKKRFSFSADDSGSNSRKSSQSFSNPPVYDIDPRKKASASNKQSSSIGSSDSAFERIAKFMGADLGSADANARAAKQKSR